MADLDDEIFSIGSGHVGPPSWPAIVSPVVLLLAEGGQGVEAVICLHPYIATAATVTACWTTCTQYKP